MGNYEYYPRLEITAEDILMQLVQKHVRSWSGHGTVLFAELKLREIERQRLEDEQLLLFREIEG